MKRLSLFALALLVLLLVLPTLAQDATAEPSPAATVDAPVVISTGQDGSVDITVEAPASPPSDTTSPFVYVSYGGLVIVLVAVLFNIPALVKIVAPLIPVDQALALAKGMVPSVSETVLNQYASKTPTPLDETLLILALNRLGYTVTKDDTGYHAVPPTTPETPPIS